MHVGNPGRSIGHSADTTSSRDVPKFQVPVDDSYPYGSRNRSDPGKPLTWIEISSVAGGSAQIPSAAPRAVRLQIVGSGQGSVPTRDILAELSTLATEITSGVFQLDARAVPLAEVEAAWRDTGTEERIVIAP